MDHPNADFRDPVADDMCMARHKRLHIADAEVGKLAERLSRLLKRSKAELVREVLREKAESLERTRLAKQRNRMILQLVDQKLTKPLTPLTKKEIEEMWAFEMILAQAYGELLLFVGDGFPKAGVARLIET